MNYSFLLKCLAGVALFSILMALLSKPTFIVVAATASLAAAASASIFLPIIPIVAAALLIAMLCTIPVVSYRGPYPAGSSFYTYNPFVPAFWFGPTFARLSWVDYWNRPIVTGNTHVHRGGGLWGGNGIGHGHAGPAGASHVHNRGMFGGHTNTHGATGGARTSTHGTFGSGHASTHNAFGGGHTSTHSAFGGGHTSNHGMFSGGGHTSVGGGHGGGFSASHHSPSFSMGGGHGGGHGHR